MNYKGYIAESILKEEKLQIENGDNNRIKVIIPSGFQGEISVRFQEPWLWRIGCIISLLTIVMILRNIVSLFRGGHKEI